MAYLNLGLSYYNLNNNGQALANYQQLIQQYPQSTEAGDALETIKNIYVEDGRRTNMSTLCEKTVKKFLHLKRIHLLIPQL